MIRQQIWQAGYFDGLAGDPPQSQQYPGKEDSYLNGYERGRGARMDTPEADRERPSVRRNPYEPDEERHFMPNPSAPKVSGYEGMTVEYKTRRMRHDIFSQPDQFVVFAKEAGLLDEVRERLYAFYLDRRHQMQGYRLIASGGRSGTYIDPPVLLGPALALHSSAIVILHNHPSGSQNFSNDDVEITKRLAIGAAVVGVQVLDHILVSSHGLTAMSQNAWMQGMLEAASTKAAQMLKDIK